jgi:hypothetical protein
MEFSLPKGTHIDVVNSYEKAKEKIITLENKKRKSKADKIKLLDLKIRLKRELGFHFRIGTQSELDELIKEKLKLENSVVKGNNNNS